jgi:hypothetical protein
MSKKKEKEEKGPVEEQKLEDIDKDTRATKVKEHLEGKGIKVEVIKEDEFEKMGFEEPNWKKDEETGNIPLKEALEKVDEFVGYTKEVKVIIWSDNYVDVAIGDNRILVGTA